eukprot:2573449-Alexandrium_andersonii.AAC.1
MPPTPRRTWPCGSTSATSRASCDALPAAPSSRTPCLPRRAGRQLRRRRPRLLGRGSPPTSSC